MAGLPVKQQHSLNSANARAREPGISVIRKPFSPISSMNPSKPSSANISEDMRNKHCEMLQKNLIVNNTPSTPLPKISPVADIENRTPSNISVPMQTTLTPASAIKSVDEEIEYSFEEKRARFVLPRSHLTAVLQV